MPTTQLTSIFEGQPSKTRPFSIKTRFIWVLYIILYIYICLCIKTYIDGVFTELNQPADKQKRCTKSQEHAAEQHEQVTPVKLGSIQPTGMSCWYLIRINGLFHPYLLGQWLNGFNFLGLYRHI